MGLDINIIKRSRKITKNGVEHDTEELAYFRKVNFLVEYFCPDAPNCEYIPITLEECEQLVEFCDIVSENHQLAEHYLPTCNGFFFGSTEYDEYYFEDIEDVKRKFKEYVIPEFNNLDPDWEDICIYLWY